MTLEQDHKVDRAGWPSGPWDGEPDRLQWTTRAGLPGLIVRNSTGALCGYAAVTSEHPAYGIHYNDLDWYPDVHGGLTYSDRCDGHICHVPEPGQPDDVWWFGFDCGHGGDFIPRFAASDLGRLGVFQGTYRDLAYVRDQVEGLAEQLAGKSVQTS